ncbi:MAG: hypothetical protein QOA14_03455, partial [Nitrososphaeraceae archaeon]|nr:hypothetical protein [Nitrososphaeraceae archaeon]
MKEIENEIMGKNPVSRKLFIYLLLFRVFLLLKACFGRKDVLSLPSQSQTGSDFITAFLPLSCYVQ